jgi:hypothetical protein
LRVRARAMFGLKTVGFSSNKAQKGIEIIYFRKSDRFVSAFEKSNCFIYIGGEEAKLKLHLKNQIWRTNH